MANLESKQMDEILDQIEYDANDLVTVVVQDAGDGTVLMIAHANREALRRTLETGQAHYWSRSRRKLWRKGESSGHVQRVREFRIDCDADCVLLRVEQVGGACHEGYRSCFFRLLRDGQFVVTAEKVFDPGKVY